MACKKLTFLGHYQEDETGSSAQFLPAQGIVLPNPHGRIPTSRYVAEVDFDRFAREQYDIGYEIDHDFSERLSFHQGAKYAKMETQYVTIFGGGLQPDLRTLDRFTFGFPEAVESVAVDSRLVMKFDSGRVRHTLLAGLDYRDVSYESAVDFGVGPSIDVFEPVYGQPVPPPPRFSHTEQIQDQLGVYLQDHIKLGSWVVTLSGRHDTVDTRLDDLLDPAAADQKQEDTEFSYRAGANYIFDSGIAPYVAYSRSFMPVLGRDFSGNAFQATLGEQYEAGMKFEPRGMPEGVKSFMALGLYELTQQNALTGDPDNLLFNVQTGEVRVKGIELEGVARFYERLSLNGSYSYTDSEVIRSNGVDLGKQVPMVPEHKISLFADYTLQTGALAGFGVGAGVRYVSETYGDGANEWLNDSTTLVDTTIHYNFSNWRVALNVNNLFDEVIVATCASSSQCFFGPRRTVLASLTRNWGRQ